MIQRTHTHTGTCQACGRQQAVNNRTNELAKHGYTVEWGYFDGVCTGGKGYEPAELDVKLTHRTIAECNAQAHQHELAVAALKAGTLKPVMFERWNRDKIKVTIDGWGRKRENRGDYDQLSIEKATKDELQAAIDKAIRKNEHRANGLRSHAAFLTSDVLTKLGKPLTPVVKRPPYVEGMTLAHGITVLKLTQPYRGRAGQHMGWRAIQVKGPRISDNGKEFRYTTRELNTYTIRP